MPRRNPKLLRKSQKNMTKFQAKTYVAHKMTKRRNYFERTSAIITILSEVKE